MSNKLELNTNPESVHNVNLDHCQHESSLSPVLKHCLSKTLLEGVEKGKQVVNETLLATDDLQFLRELKGSLQKQYNIQTRTLTITPELMEQLRQIKNNPENSSKAAILDVIGIDLDKFVYTKEELDQIRENLNQDIEATGKRIDYGHQQGTEIYNLNMQIIQMLKAIVKGHDNAISAANRRIHR